MKIRATSLALGVLALTGCGHVSQGDYETGMESLRSEMNGRIETLERTDRDTMDRLDGLEDRIEFTESELAALRAEIAEMEDVYGMRIEELERAMVVAVPVYFGFDKANVRPEGAEALARFSRMVRKWYPDARITVEGFTDTTGPAEYNEALGMRRAEAVRSELVSLGLSDDRLSAVSYGENTERLVIPGAGGPGTDGWQNRRVTLVVEHAPTAVTTAQDATERDGATSSEGRQPAAS